MYLKTARTVVLGASCLTLAACFGSSNAAGPGGGPGGGPVDVTAYDAKYQALTVDNTTLPPTSVELTGQATFSGTTKLEVFDASDATKTGYALGDLAVAADFDAETISGAATNFRGEVDGQAITLTGTLDSANAIAPSTLQEVTSPIILPPGLPPIPGAPTSVTTNTFAVNMGGELTDSAGDSVGNVQLGIGGAFLGPIGGTEATAAVGPATLVVDQPATPGLINIGGAGTFYLERD